MLFWLVCRECDINEVDWSRWIDALDNLGEAGYRGDHLVLGDRPILAHAQSMEGLSRKARTYFASVAAKLSTIGSVSRSVTRTEIDPSVLAATSVAGVEVVPLSHFSGPHSAEKALLLCEHMYDYTVAQEFASIRLRALGLATICKSVLRPASGGGGGIHLTLSTYQLDANTLGVCLLDSDRGHPHDSLGTTARTCKAAYRTCWKWKVHVLAARELENLIPPEVADAAGFVDLRKADYYRDDCWGVGGYVDFKESDLLCRFFEIEPDSQSYAPVQAAIAALSSSAVTLRECCSDRDCQRLAICGLNSLHGNLLARLAAWMTPLGVTRRVGSISTVSAFDELGDSILRAGLAPAFTVR